MSSWWRLHPGWSSISKVSLLSTIPDPPSIIPPKSNMDTKNPKQLKGTPFSKPWSCLGSIHVSFRECIHILPLPQPSFFQVAWPRHCHAAASCCWSISLVQAASHPMAPKGYRWALKGEKHPPNFEWKHRWSLLVLLIGGRSHIITQLTTYTTYIAAFWGVICYLPPINGTRKLHWHSKKNWWVLSREFFLISM